MRRDLQEQVTEWQDQNGAHDGDLSDHACKVLEEAIELCFAAGASASDVQKIMRTEIIKAAFKQEITEQFSSDDVAEELADVLICLLALAHHANVDIDHAVEHKLTVLREREWAVSPSGVLRRRDRI